MIGNLPALDPSATFGLGNAGAGLGARDSSARSTAQAGMSSSRGNSDLSADEQRALRELQQTDRKVRAHEMAHVAAGAGLVSKGASYSYETGPDGQRYAVAGEVSIDTSPGGTPEETIEKARQIKAAALAPANPSPQDRSVAAMADRMAVQAALEITMREREEGSTTDRAVATGTASPQPTPDGSDRRSAIETAYGRFAATRPTHTAGIDAYA